MNDPAHTTTEALAKTIALAWLQAFNNKDIQALVALYHANATHVSPKLRTRSPETRGLVQGAQALREWWNDAFLKLPSLHYQLTRLTFGPSNVFIEYTRTVQGEEDVCIAELLEIKDQLILHSRVFHG